MSDDMTDWPQPPVNFPTMRSETERGLYDVIDKALLGRFSPSRRRLLVGNILLAVSRWRSAYLDCGCFTKGDGYAFCGWHERAFRAAGGHARDERISAIRNYVFVSTTISALDRHRLLAFIDDGESE